jgi:hypothetical protein
MHKGKGLGKGISSYVGHESTFVEAMDTCWKHRKACDTGLTLLGIWMLTNSGETPEKCIINLYFQHS